MAYACLGRSMDLDTFSAMVVTFQIRSVLRVLQVPSAMSGHVGRSVTFHGTLIASTYALGVASAAVLVKKIFFP